MPSMARVTILGVVGKVEVLDGASGKRTRMRVAVAQKGGTPETAWYGVTVFGERAKWIEDTAPGDHVLVVGRLARREWDREGRSGVELDVVADDVRVVSRKRRDDGGKEEGADELPF